MSLPWMEAEWLNEVETWVSQQIRLAEGLVEVQTRPTGAVLKTADHEWFFKAVVAPYRHEPAVTEYLSRRWPHLIPEVAAIDVERGWMLQRNGGITLRSLTKEEGNLDRWEPILVEFADFQIASLDWQDDLLAVGLPERRLSQLPDLFENLVHDPNLLSAEEHEEGIPDEERAVMQQMRERVEGWCAELAEYEIPETLHHDDFHANNIMIRGNQFGVIDWGESFWAHPFYSLFMILRYGCLLMDVPMEDPMIETLRDAYLDVWSEIEPMARLVEAYELARRMAKLSRALTWHTYQMSLPAALRAEDAGAVEYWLRAFVGFQAE